MLAVNLRALTMSPELRTDTTHPDGDGRFFDAGDVLIGMSYARSLTDKFSAGLNVNFVQETLADYKASSIAFDLGVLYDTGYRSLRLGMTISNIGSEMQFISDGQSIKLPAVFSGYLIDSRSCSAFLDFISCMTDSASSSPSFRSI